MTDYAQDARNIIQELIDIHQNLSSGNSQALALNYHLLNLNSLISNEHQAGQPILKSIEQLLSQLSGYTVNALAQLDKEREFFWCRSEEATTTADPFAKLSVLFY